MPYSSETSNQFLEKPTPTPSIDSLIAKLSTEEHAKSVEKTQNQLGSFAYYRLPKRYIPYQKDPNSIDYRFQNETFRVQDPI